MSASNLGWLVRVVGADVEGKFEVSSLVHAFAIDGRDRDSRGTSRRQRD